VAALDVAEQKNSSWGMVFVLVFILLAIGSFAEFAGSLDSLDSLMLRRTVQLSILGMISFLIGRFVVGVEN